MHVVYAARYHIDIGLHVFPTMKYRLVRERLGDGSHRTSQRPLPDTTLGPDLPAALEFVEPPPASWESLALVHTAEYLQKMRTGALSSEELAQLQLPWSEEIVEGYRLMVGGTMLAADLACATGLCCHLAGGLHHAFANHGEGFCPFNDVAVAIRTLQARGIDRAAVVDLDVHHGNGTSFIFESDPRVFTFSMHQQHNYPLWKPRSSLDIGLPDGTHDATYLRALEAALPRVLEHRPACVFYLAGADPYEDDQLGGLRLTKGLRARDRLVIHAVRTAGLPLVITLAGGYARDVSDTVAIHVATIEEARRVAR